MKKLTSLKTRMRLSLDCVLFTQWVTITVALLSLININTKAQNTPIAWSAGNTQLRAISYVDFSWLYYYPNANITPSNFWQTYGNSFGLGSTQMQLSKQNLPDTATDTIGVASYFYTQLYSGVPIENTEYVLHFKHGILNASHGQIVENFSTSVTPHISTQNAIDAALGYIHASKYYWQDTLIEDSLKAYTNDPSATYYPTPKLIFAQILPDNFTASNFKLAYFMEIASQDSIVDSINGSNIMDVYVDANTGAVIRAIAPGAHCNDVPATVATTWQGTQSMDIDKHLGWFSTTYKSYDDCRNIYVRLHKEHPWAWTAYDTYGSTTIGGNAASLLWGIEKAHQYFIDDRKRMSMDGKGGSVHGFYNWKYTGPNSKYVNSIGWGSPKDYIYVTGKMEMLDIIAHEYTHGITNYTANLNSGINIAESDALNESFSDIFGTIIERYYMTAWTWVIGDYCIKTNFGIDFWRSLSDPHTSPTNITGLSGQPKSYKEYGYWDPAGHSHHNDGVQNYVFYQLVNSIGWDHATNIVWRALTVYANHNSTYDVSGGNSIRNAWLAAVQDLYGQCSYDYAQTQNAWNAVGVGSSSNPFCVNITGSYHFCLENVGNYNSTHLGTLVYNANASITSGTTYTWTVPTGIGYTTSGGGSILTINSLPTTWGIYTIYVTAFNGGAPSNTSMYYLYVLSCIDDDKVGRHDRSIDTLSINSSKINIYPNPTNHHLLITGLNSNDLLTIFDAEGNKIMQPESSIIAGGRILNVSTLPSGIYFIEVKNNLNITRHKFVKTNE